MFTMKLIEKNGKKVVEMEYKGTNIHTIEYAAVYGWNKEPYIKRMGQKFYLSPETLAGETLSF